MVKHGTALLMLTLATSLAYAQTKDATYFGVWRYDPAKSDLGMTQITVAESAGGEFTLTDDRAKTSYTFRMDGKGYPDPSGMIVSWTKKSPRSWEAIYSSVGKRVAIETYTLSDDGKSLTSHATVEAMKGKQELVMTRVAGRDGLVGTWQGKLQLPAFDLEIRPNGTDGLVFAVPGSFEVKAMFDGKPHPMTGPLIAKPSTAAFTRIGPSSFRTVQKEGDKTMLEATVTVSADGSTLTESGVAEGNIKRTWVFTRAKQ